MSNLIIPKIINTRDWIEENSSSFLPPVCNKLMHNQQLVIMFVGGPNQREDYHIEEGEELFYQIKGDMCVKIIENGCHKDIHVKQGEFFILPARVPHSPQRTTNSVGLVIERRRLPNEKDGVRWFVPNSVDALYEKWFNCKDLGTELIPLIKNYFASEEYQTKIPKNNILQKSEYPFEFNNVLIQTDQHGPYNLEEKISQSSDMMNLTNGSNLQFDVQVLKKGNLVLDNFSNDQTDVWIWQLEGNSELALTCLNNNQPEQHLVLNKFDSILVSHTNFKNILIKINQEENSQIMVITQNPNKKF